MYAKIKDNQLQRVPVNYTRNDGTTVSNFNLLSEEDWKAEGFKPVLEDSPPDNINRYKPIYADTGNEIVIDNWELVLPDADDIAALAFVQAAQDGKLDNAAILENPALFQAWDENFRGKLKTIVQHKGHLYRLINDDSYEEPSEGSSYWEHIGSPDDEYPQWFCPIGINDAYRISSRVSHDGKKWESVVNLNTWQPGIYGWKEVE